MADSAGTALSGAAVSTMVCAYYADVVGISFFLLVPIRMGDSCFSFDVCRVSKD